MSARDAARKLKEYGHQLLTARSGETPVSSGQSCRRLGELIDRLHDTLDPVERIHAVGWLDALQEAVEELLSVPYRGVDVPPDPKYDARLGEAIRAVEAALANVWPVRMTPQTGTVADDEPPAEAPSSPRPMLGLGEAAVDGRPRRGAHLRSARAAQFTILDAFQGRAGRRASISR